MVDTNKFAGVSELFKSNNNDNLQNIDREFMDIDLDDLVDFHDHCFPRYTEDMLQEMMKSIEDVGLLEPILVREHPDIRGKFEILSGHNRVEACRRLNLKGIHVRVFPDLTEDQAKLIVIETNLKQRNFSDFKPSVRAAIVSEWHKLMKNQGLRTDLMREIENRKNISEDEKNAPFQLGKSQVANYVRIHRFLLEELKDKLDDGSLTIKSCVELSSLESDEQVAVNEYIENENKISEGMAKTIRKESEDNVVTLEFIEKLFSKKEKKKKEKKDIKVPAAVVDKYFKESNEEDVLNIIQIALDHYFSQKLIEKQMKNESEVIQDEAKVEIMDDSLSFQLPEDNPDLDSVDGD